MSLFNWFSGKSQQANALANGEARRAVPLPQRQAPEAAHSGEARKFKRHARREQLYVAIREAMTRAGVLSARYKFKVLSLDQNGDEFLVMVDLAKDFGRPTEQLGDIEALIVQNAKARFSITVPAVYWRQGEVAAVAQSAPGAVAQAERSPAHADAAVRAPLKPVQPLATPPYEPIQADEVAAFKQALLAASARGSTVAAEGGVKVRRSRSRSSTQPTGFADTELAEAPSSPALSTTQYGDLH
ncbi:hypothetical protein [Polaromonas jejuensis]|uniref:Uncharacterized protein n=1 Tax=Polaromonas jejuensis TaxID=457502 RepID=A0ABW0QCI4_9BURK|nr:hypothetical protein [Polaromonas jejuensis]